LRHYGETTFSNARLSHAFAKAIPNDSETGQAWPVAEENTHVNSSSSPLIIDIENQTLMRLL